MTTSHHDRELWRDLRDVFDAVDPVPPEVTAVARGAMAFRTLDAELGDLVADSAELAGATRDGPGARLITFESGTLVIEVEVGEAADDRRRLVGQLVAPSAAAITVQWPGGEQQVEADDLGRFAADEVPAGPVRLHCRRPGAPAVTTGWVVV